MTNLTTLKSVPDFKVNPTTGEAFISVKKTAKLLGVPRTTLRDYLTATHNYDRKQGLTPEILSFSATYFSAKGNQQAEQVLAKLTEAGAKAFIYHQAGYKVQAIPTQENVPKTHIQAVEAYLQTLKELEAKDQVITMQTEIIETKQGETDSSTESFTIRRIRLLNQGMKIDPKILLKVCKALGVEPETVFDLYEQSANSYPRSVWEEAYPDAILP